MKGILAAGTETDPPPEPTGDRGAAAHLHGPSQLFAGVIPMPTTDAAAVLDPATAGDAQVILLPSSNDDPGVTTTAGWTGARWGELTGLQRPNLHLFDDDTGYFDPDIGALHEDAKGNLWLGPPKTPESARRVHLAPFNVRLLRAHLKTHDSPMVFPTPDGGWHRRSNFSRRAMRPAADGTAHLARPPMHLQPAKPGQTFHGTRHGHKTWMIADGIPDAAQDLRLGHLMPDKVRKTYSHVASSVETRLLECLQERWEKAVLNSNHQLDTGWRDGG